MFAECCFLVELGPVMGQRTTVSLRPNWVSVPSRVASHLPLSPLTWIISTSQPRGLPEGAFCGACIEQLCLPSDFHNVGPRACENCKNLVEGYRDHSPSFFHICPLCRLKQHMAPATTHADRQRSFLNSLPGLE